MISFNSLPNNRSNGATLPDGLYKATVVKAEVKTSNAGKEYLSCRYQLTDDKGNTGTMFDNFFDTEKELPRFKLYRFITALRLQLGETFEFKDLAKIITNKQFVIAVKTEEDATYGNRNVVDVFYEDIYYPINNWAALTGAPEEINASDAEEIPMPTDDDAY